MPRESDLSECLTGTSILCLAPKLPSQARPTQQRPPNSLSCFLELSHSTYSACHCTINLYMLFIKMLSHLTLVRYIGYKCLSLSIGYFFILLTVSLLGRSFLVWYVPLIYFCFYYLCFWCNIKIKNSCQDQSTSRIFPPFSSRSFTISSFTFKL